MRYSSSIMALFLGLGIYGVAPIATSLDPFAASTAHAQSADDDGTPDQGGDNDDDTPDAGDDDGTDDQGGDNDGMQDRHRHSQRAAARAGFSERTGRRIDVDHRGHRPSQKQ